jgi:2-iminobutanoate/2-iminopropanoate deaminase
MKHPAVSYPRDPSTPVSHFPFSPAVRVGDFVFVSGQASVDAGGKIVAGTFDEECRRSIENLRAVLISAGSDLAHVVQTRNYVRESENLPRFNEIYREYFAAPYPARTTITHCLPESLHFEIECIAVLKTD